MAVIVSQVADPSVAAVLFQCQAFRDRLRDEFISSEYPPEALKIVRCFELLLDRLERRLISIQSDRQRDATSGECVPLLIRR